MTKQSKKIGTITLIGKPNEATEGDANKPSRTGKVIVQTTIGITHLPELGGKAWAWLETHDFEAIKKHREYLYHTFILEEFLNERRIKVLLTTSKDLEDLRRSWLNDELREIDRLMEIPQMSRSDRHELSKYRTAVNDELEGREMMTKSIDKQVPNKKESTKQEKRIGYQYFAFYQIITENTPKMKVLRMPESSVKDKKEFAQKIFQELRGDTLFNGTSFYIEYQRLKGLYNDKKLLNEVNNPFNPEAKRRFKEYTFRIAEYFGNEDYKRWWGNTFTQ